MKWKQHDGGRSRSNRPGQRRDCVVRAVAIAACLPYDLVYDQFADAGRKSGRSTPKPIWKGYLAQARKLSFPAVKGQRRTSLRDFAAAYSSGRYVVQCAGHLMAVVNGFVYDDQCPRANACVYAAFQL